MHTHSHAPGTLYVVATPIGNLDDLTIRAQRVLAQVGIVAAEDTRRTQQLLSHLGLSKPLESYHEHNERDKADKLLGALLDGTDVAIVTDAGVPVVSDPGTFVVSRALRAGVRVCPIPGPSATLAALSVSGFSADRFLFAGYPPRRASDRRGFYQSIAQYQWPVVVYEAPHRLRESLADAVAAIGGEREAVIGREMTKQFEEITQGTLAELTAHYKDREPLGEFTMVLGPAAPAEARQPAAAGDPDAAADLLAATDLPTRSAAAILAAACGLSRNEAYEAILGRRDRASR